MKITALILLLLLLGSSLFYYGFFDFSVMRIKEKASQSVALAKRDHTLKLFKIAVSQSAQYSSDEIWIADNLYDVGERKIVGDTMYLSLYHDADEENILAEINDFFKPDNNVINLPSGVPILKTVHIAPNPQFVLKQISYALFINRKASGIFAAQTIIVSFPFHEILTPPPQLA